MNFLSLCKISIYALFLNYYCYSVFTGHLFPGLSAALYLLMCIGLFMHVMTKPERTISFLPGIGWWFGYTILSWMTIIFAQSTSYAISGLIKFMQRLFLIFLIGYICEEEKNIRFAINLLFVISIALAGSCLINLDGIHGRLNLSSGSNISVNDVGALLAYGCFAVQAFFSRAKMKENQV